MSVEDLLPVMFTGANTSVLPTDRLIDLCRAHDRMAEALIEIACLAFQDSSRTCGYCEVTADRECWDGCPGLLARRALGVA